MANNDGNNAPVDELEQAIQQLAEITGTDEAFAHFMLQENDYDLNRALTSFFNAQQQNEQAQIESKIQQQDSLLDDQSQNIDKSASEAADVNHTKLEEKEAEGDTDNQNIVNTPSVLSNLLEPPAEKRFCHASPSNDAPSFSQIEIDNQEQEFPKDLTLFSWNIDGLEDANLIKRFTAVLYCIAKANPEVVFLQEMVPKLMAQLKGLMAPMYNIYIQETDIGYFCVTLVSKNIKILNNQTMQFSNSQMGRGMLIVEGKWQQLNLKLLNTHLESVKENVEARRVQFSRCIERLIFMTAANPADTLAIFGGDLNIRDNEVCSLPVAVKDAWIEAGSNQQFRYTWDMLRNDNYEGRLGNAKPRCRFDRIYYAGPCCNKVDFRLEGLSRIKGPNCFASDHFAMVCRFALNKDDKVENAENVEKEDGNSADGKDEFVQFGDVLLEGNNNNKDEEVKEE